MPIDLGLESLVQRGKTPFFTELTAIYQDSLNAVMKLTNPSHDDVLDMLMDVDFKKRITACVYTHMKIPLKYVVIKPLNHLNFSCQMDVTRTTLKEVETGKKTPGMILDNIKHHYDDRLGQYTSADVTKLGVTFGLELHTSAWRIRNAAGQPYLPATELAAVTLHEFGHIDHFVREAIRVYGRMVDASDIIDYIGSRPDKAEILKLIALIKKSKYVDKEWNKILDATEAYFKKTNSFDDPYYFEALSTLTFIVASQVTNTGILVADDILGNVSDKVKTRLYSVDVERSPDEFAARNGAYVDLVASLKKLSDLQGKDIQHEFNQSLWNGAAVVLSYLYHFAEVFDFRAEDIDWRYDSMLKRLELIIETAKHAFHDDLPKDVRDDITAQIKDAEAYLHDYKTSIRARRRIAIKHWKDTVSKFGRIIAAPFYNPLSKDYERLQDATRSLGRHPLYYLAKR